jgi:hypothetical protein
MTIIVPTSVDVKAMVAGLRVSPTKAKGLEMRTNYFLSQVMTTNENWMLNKDNNFYRNICSKTMKQIIGDDYYGIMELLTGGNDPVVESDDSYSNFSSHDQYCKGYRLTAKYNTGEFLYRELPRKFSAKITKYLPEDAEAARMTEHYSFLIDQYHKHRLTLNPSVYEFISNFGQQLLQRVEEDNQYQKNMVYNHIGRWLHYIQKVEYGELKPMVAGTNHRLNSVFTNLPKVLRGFVICNGKLLHSVDISASQPYLLGKVMDSRFFNDTSNGFNLFSIYKEVYDILLDNGYLISVPSYPNSGMYPFMWSVFFTPKELDSILEYQQIPFLNDYYRYVISKGYDYQLTEQELLEKRNEFKKSTMYILFDDHKGHRLVNQQVRLFKHVYPGVNKWLELSHKVIGNREFSLIMQRCESWLLLNNVCRKFLNQYPNIPLFTIHDGLYTYKEYTPHLSSLILTICSEMVGVEPGLKIEPPRLEIYPRQQDVDEVWVEIKPINSKDRFEKIKGGVFSANIELGKNFMTSLNNQITKAA